ncbi:NAD(P)H-dependent oxidoreductase subunit E [Thauera sp. 63]|uniref:NAD(P)H-dependent oxidoreductase subunit E n=1 Tax=Thauera sp. 63 TaxID=497321 RepID=UPI000684EA29|nr:NAD(P)H-dependent oxidoreductase subunit E [Thauera sp. 63]
MWNPSKQEEGVAVTNIESILDRHSHEAHRLVQILRATQDALGWLAPETLTCIAHRLQIPRVQVESTANFYSFFHIRPLGEYRILFSDNITDRMLGNQALMQALCEKLWLEPGRVAEDGLVSVDTTSCTGMCDQGPALLANYRAITRLTPARIDEMAHLIRRRVPVGDWPPEWFHVEDNIRRRDVLLDHGLAPGEALAAALDRGPTGLLGEIERSALRGRGGAGFGSDIKWRSCRDAWGDAHYVICNADEGEPGTFKDRVLLSSDFDMVVDGMCIAGFAIGANKGFIYLRGEYRYLLDRLETRLAQRREAGLLGRDILGRGFTFDIEIHLGAGAYICGEESALIESLEGKPGKPRIRPPFPVTHGYLGQPTTVNNVETLALAALIAVRGGEWFRAIGTPASTGTKLLSVSGDVARPGIYEFPFGVTVAEVLEAAGATDTQAVTTAGAAGSCLAASEFGRRIAFEDVPTGGSIMVFDQSRDMFEAARNFAHFFAHESCGFCTPCRVGTAVNARLMDKLALDRGSPYDLDEMERMHHLMQGASHCGLGNTATIALRDILAKFRPAFDRRLHSPDYEPGFDLDAALSQARRMTGRDDAGAHLTDNRSAHAGGHPSEAKP